MTDQSEASKAIDLPAMFKRSRAYVKHQYDLTNHRTTWFVTMHAFLFATFGFTIQKRLEVVTRPLSVDAEASAALADLTAIDCFLFFQCMVGSISACLVFFLIEAARYPIKQLADSWERLIGVDGIKHPLCLREALEAKGELLLVGGYSRKSAIYGRLLTLSFPFCLALAWTLTAIFSVLTPDTILAFNHLFGVVPGSWFLVNQWIAVAALPIVLTVVVAAVMFCRLAIREHRAKQRREQRSKQLLVGDDAPGSSTA